MNEHLSPKKIETLSGTLSGRIVLPGQADYDALRAIAMANYDHKPAAIVRPANAADVAAALAFASRASLEIAIRSGGHSSVGHGSTNGGLVIDLRDINDIEVDPKARTVWAGGGASVGDIIAAVEPHKLVVGFGDSATVGVGGITLGGGIGYLVRKFGLTIDSLLAAEVVTAAGETITTDDSNHPDLFWALRGGGGNFGVVTRFKFRLHPLPDFVGGPLILPATAEVVAGFIGAIEAAPEELSGIALVMTAPPLPFLPAHLHGTTIFMGMMAYVGDIAGADKALAPFRALAKPIADHVAPAPYSSLFIPGDPNPPTVSMASRLTDRVDPNTARTMLAALERTDAPVKMLQIRVMGGAAARVPDDATAFAHRQSRMTVAFISLYSGGRETIAKQDRWAAEAIRTLAGPEQPAYVNFLGNEGEVGIEAAYPPKTLARLRQIKRRYDPNNLFRLNQNITPA